MKILAVEFSGPERSVAVLRTGANGSVTCVAEAAEAGSRATRAFALVEAVLAQAQIEREQIQVLAIGLGPGSYTGVRVAISLAQGWELATGVPLLGISSVECVAHQAYAEDVRGKVAVVIDAQRGEFYLADYELDAAGVRVLTPLRITGREEVERSAKSGSIIVGPEVRKWFGGGRVVHPRAARLAHLALTRKDFVPGAQLEPIYLRPTSFVKAPPPRPLPG